MNWKATSRALADFWKDHRVAIMVGSFWWTFGAWFYLQAIQKRSDGWYFGNANVWSDWSLHTSQVTRFVQAPMSEWWQNTYFAGGKLTYPFFSNLVSAILVRMGGSYQFAMIGPSLVFWAATVVVLLWFGTWVLRSSTQAALALTLFLTSAGLGVLRANSLSEVLYPIQDFTQFPQYQWGTGNLFLGMFLPQRAFLLGFWIALLAWGTWLKTLERPWKVSKARWILLAGFIAGVLPIIHMHSFMAVVLLSIPVAWYFSIEKWRETLLFATAAGLASMPLYLSFVAGGIERSDFFQVNPGWTAPSFVGWFVQWGWQWGVMIPLAATSLFFLKRKLQPLRWWVLLSFWIVFFLGNIVQFQPVAWDNTKLFLWVYLGFSLAAAAGLSALWQRGALLKATAIVLVILATCTGAVELWRSAHVSRYTYLATSNESYELARQVAATTQPDEVFATAPIHNHWVTMWAGRPIVMGYSTWVWNFGYLHEQREHDLARIFTDPDQRQNIIEKYNVRYLVVGPDEEAAYRVRAEDFTQYPVFLESPAGTVFLVQ